MERDRERERDLGRRQAGLVATSDGVTTNRSDPIRKYRMYGMVSYVHNLSKQVYGFGESTGVPFFSHRLYSMCILSYYSNLKPK